MCQLVWLFSYFIFWHTVQFLGIFCFINCFNSSTILKLCDPCKSHFSHCFAIQGLAQLFQKSSAFRLFIPRLWGSLTVRWKILGVVLLWYVNSVCLTTWRKNSRQFFKALNNFHSLYLCTPIFYCIVFDYHSLHQQCQVYCSLDLPFLHFVPLLLKTHLFQQNLPKTR